MDPSRTGAARVPRASPLPSNSPHPPAGAWRVAARAKASGHHPQVLWGANRWFSNGVKTGCVAQAIHPRKARSPSQVLVTSCFTRPFCPSAGKKWEASFMAAILCALYLEPIRARFNSAGASHSRSEAPFDAVETSPDLAHLSSLAVFF